MTQWQRTLRIPEWDRSKSGLSISQLAGVIAGRLKRLRPFGDEYLDAERDEIADDFAALASDADSLADDFDDVMERLYDWADSRTEIGGSVLHAKKACWIDRQPR